MKRIILGIITIMIVLVTIVVQTEVTSELMDTHLDTKRIASSYLHKEIEEELEEEIIEIAPRVEVPERIIYIPQVYVPVYTYIPTRTVLSTMTGSMSAYSPNCHGCSGITASGLNLRGRGIFYQDHEFGQVRILAGDPSLPFGTIIRTRGLSGGDFYGIVLDRGGAIGKGRRHLFDLLFTTNQEAVVFGIAHNVTFEVLRLGR